jgi:hypothetical protein
MQIQARYQLSKHSQPSGKNASIDMSLLQLGTCIVDSLTMAHQHSIHQPNRWLVDVVWRVSLHIR